MRLSSLLLIATFAVACDNRNDLSHQAPLVPPPSSKTTPAPVPSAAVQGKVLETMDAATYTYLRLQTASGETWAAVPQAKVAVGSDATIVNSMVMTDFESKTLNRKFDRILFGTLGGGAASPTAEPSPAWAQPGALPAGHPATTPPADPGAGAPVAKAQGSEGRTVAEIFSQKTGLKDKAVAIRGRVVKYNAGVLGKNWLHLRDGSGAEGTNDITVTSQDAAALGDVVLVKGPVHLDRDFGAGYAYDVIIEDAKLSK